VMGQLADHPMRVAWIGDYSDSVEINDLGGGFIKSRRSFLFYYRRAWHEKLAAPLVDDAEYFPLDVDKAHYFLCNTTKNCFLDLQQYVDSNITVGGWCVNPLPLLTCIGNGQGGGDYFEKLGAEDVGTWSFDEIYLTESKPENMTEVFFSFQERW